MGHRRRRSLVRRVRRRLLGSSRGRSRRPPARERPRAAAARSPRPHLEPRHAEPTGAPAARSRRRPLRRRLRRSSLVRRWRRASRRQKRLIIAVLAAEVAIAVALGLGLGFGLSGDEETCPPTVVRPVDQQEFTCKRE